MRAQDAMHTLVLQAPAFLAFCHVSVHVWQLETASECGLPAAVVVQGAQGCCPCSKQSHIHRDASAEQPSIALWRLACSTAANPAA